jgi:hypothetical protein
MSAMQTIMALRPRRGLRFPMPASGHATPESPSTPGGYETPKAEASESNVANTPGKENRDVGPSDAAASVGGGIDNAVSATAASPSDNVAPVDRQEASTLHSILSEQAPSAGVNGADVNGASRSERVPRRVQCGRVERSARSRASFTESDRPAAFPGPPKSKEPHRLVAELFSASRVEINQLWNPFGAGWAAKKRLEKQLRRLAGGLREEVERREAAERELERLLWGVASQGVFDVGRVKGVTNWSLEGGKEGPRELNGEPVDFSGEPIWHGSWPSQLLAQGLSCSGCPGQRVEVRVLQLCGFGSCCPAQIVLKVNLLKLPRSGLPHPRSRVCFTTEKVNNFSGYLLPKVWRRNVYNMNQEFCYISWRKPR